MKAFALFNDKGEMDYSEVESEFDGSIIHQYLVFPTKEMADAYRISHRFQFASDPWTVMELSEIYVKRGARVP